MNQPSENIGGRIGALELSDAAAVMDDRMLEASAVTLSMGPPTNPSPCTILCAPHRIEDGALEDAAGAVYAGSTNQPSICSPPTWQMSGCRRIDDGALEDAAGYVAVGPSNTGPCPPMTLSPICRRIDDGALEASGEMAMHPRTNWRNPMGECV